MIDFIIIANPTSGSRSAPKLATRAKELLQGEGASVELRVTSERGDAQRFSAEAVSIGIRAVVGCGGDGTLQEIATALDGTQTAMGILPGGRCNDFAQALGFKKTDPAERLVSILRANQRRAVDLGAIGDKRFLTVATLGFDSDVSRFVETHKLWFKGTLAYTYGVLRILRTFKAPLVKLHGDFGVREGRVLLAATGNASCYGGAMHIAPGAKLDDGLFHLCVVDQVSRLTVLGILPRVLKGTHVHHPAVHMLTSRIIEIESPEKPLWICADGESLAQTPCRIEVRPGALQVLAPVEC